MKHGVWSREQRSVSLLSDGLRPVDWVADVLAHVTLEAAVLGFKRIVRPSVEVDALGFATALISEAETFSLASFQFQCVHCSVPRFETTLSVLRNRRLQSVRSPVSSGSSREPSPGAASFRGSCAGSSWGE